MILQAKKYKSRAELESDIAKQVGRNTNKEKDCVIKGKSAELKALNLSESCSVFNCSVELIK